MNPLRTLTAVGGTVALAAATAGCGDSTSAQEPPKFVILRTGKPAAKLGSGSRVSENGHVGEIGDMAPGATKSVTLDLRPGHCSVICNLPSHYKMGMHADLTVS